LSIEYDYDKNSEEGGRTSPNTGYMASLMLRPDLLTPASYNPGTSGEIILQLKG